MILQLGQIIYQSTREYGQVDVCCIVNVKDLLINFMFKVTNYRLIEL